MADQPGPPSFTIPDALPVLPIRDSVVFPLTAVPLSVGQARSLRLVDDVMRGNRLLALMAQRDPKAEPAGPDDLHLMEDIHAVVQRHSTRGGAAAELTFQPLDPVEQRLLAAARFAPGETNDRDFQHEARVGDRLTTNVNDRLSHHLDAAHERDVADAFRELA